jgi:hypothetical protein
MADDVNTLTIEFCGEYQQVGPDQTLTFGRRGDLVVDENPYLHRVVGRFVFRQGLWWLQNLGSKITVEMRDRNSSSRIQVASGQQAALVYRTFAVTFSAGPTQYELCGDRAGGQPSEEEPYEAFGTATIDFGVVPLSAEQHLLLVALCELKLMSDSEQIPTNQALAARLGWTITKFNRKLDHLCAKLAREGVRGLRGGPDGLATDRRQALIEHALSVGLVAHDDLGLLSRQAS